MIKVEFHPEARNDLDEIWEYIRATVSMRPLRFAIVREYLIAYAPEEDLLWVVAVLHGRRNPRVMAAILRGRSSS